MIKPEDIPDELIEKLVRPRKSDDWKQQIADDLNVMIEAGVVSPPCYVIRNQRDGRLYHDVGQVRLRPGKPQIPAHEHWKGQTE